MKPEGAVREVVDCFQSEGIGSPVCDFVSSVALHSNIVVASEYSPDSAHFCSSLISVLEKKSHRCTYMYINKEIECIDTFLKSILESLKKTYLYIPILVNVHVYQHHIVN